jgi:hypothetical protein
MLSLINTSKKNYLIIFDAIEIKLTTYAKTNCGNLTQEMLTFWMWLRKVRKFLVLGL